MVAPSCEHFYIGGDMHSHERLLVNYAFLEQRTRSQMSAYFGWPVNTVEFI